jgi:glutathione S-transferase
MVILGYEKGPDDVLKWYTQEVPGIIAKFSKMLGETAYLTGDKPSIDDFKLYSFLHKMNIIQEDLGSPETAGTVTADLVAYMKRIEELPRIKEYMASPDYMSKPVNRSMAKWDGH